MRPQYIWGVFSVCLIVVFITMVWASAIIVQLDYEETQAQNKAAVEEDIRLALWHLDSNVSPLIAQENARPYFFYTAFYPIERAYTKMFNKIQRGDVLVPSPLIKNVSPYVLIHFQFSPDGSVSSPQAPQENMRDIAEVGYSSQENIIKAEKYLQNLQQKLTREALLPLIPEKYLESHNSSERIVFSAPDLNNFSGNYIPETNNANEFVVNPNNRYNNQQRNMLEREARMKSYQQAAIQNRAEYSRSFGEAENVKEGIIAALWIDDMLILARKVSINGQIYIQGCWLDWEKIKLWLLTQVQQFLFVKDLEPAKTEIKQSRTLASLPIRLIPGNLDALKSETISPIYLSLFIAWGGLLLAAVAFIALLTGVISLSERRGAFVSSVTHELRTPLTTFRMYTEMLLGGMVKPEKREKYLTTLQAEADRLGHLVENVLAYSRLESKRATRNLENFRLEELIDKVNPPLLRRANEVGMELKFNIAEHKDCILRTEAGAVEQILFNLVDNSCKYAISATNKSIEITAKLQRKYLVLEVRDYGPGISPKDSRNLFSPFCKSAKDAAHSAPGVGLGLALCRRLARHLKGDLRADLQQSGACFCLKLPVTCTS